MKSMIRRQSPALIVAVIALIAALGGTALAGGPITKKKAKKVANNVVTQRAPGLSVAHANTAGVADKLGPLSGGRFDYRATDGSGQTNIASFGAVTLTGDCSTNATDLELAANTNNVNAKSLYGDESGTTFADAIDGGNSGDFIDLNTDFSGPFLIEATGQANAVSAGGTVTTIQYGTEDNEIADCQAWGTALAG